MGHRNSWKKLRPNSNQELEDALMAERMLTQKWYQRMSGQVQWGPGERKIIESAMDQQSEIVKKLMPDKIV